MSFGIPVRNGLMLGLTASTALSAGRGLPIPALSLNFLSGTLDSRITFSRGTNATLIDSTGRLTYAPNNLVQRSQELENVYWVKLAVSATGDVTTAPDGTTTADKVVATASAFTRRLLYANATLSASTNIFSFYAKASEYSLVRTVDSAGGSRWFASFDLSNGTLVGGTTGGAQFVSAGISDAGNGWYRCWVVFNAAAGAGAIGMVGYPAGATLDQFGVQYAGDGTSGTFFWGLQLEQATYQTTPSAYAVTTSALYYGPRFDYDPVTLQPRGLLIEEARTNSITYSDDWSNAAWVKSGATVTANATASPDGTVNADKVVETATTAPHAVYQVFTYGAGLVYAATVYAKKAERNWIYVGADTAAAEAVFFDLDTGTVGSQGTGYVGSITNAGNGWYRCTVIITQSTALPPNFLVVGLASANNTPSYAGNGTSGVYLYGAQLEAGSFATSYIPTVASTVTRNADVATMTGTNFSSWYNQSEGTFAVQATSAIVNTTTRSVATILNSGTPANCMRVILSLQRQFNASNSGATQADLDGGDPVSGANTKIAAAYAVNNFALSLNGGAVVTDVTGTVPTVNTLTFGANEFDASRLNGHIRTFVYFSPRLPNDRLVALST